MVGKKKNFAGKKNADLWNRFLELYPLHTISFVWVKGHAGNPENERCDELATKAADQHTNLLLIDDVYENGE